MMNHAGAGGSYIMQPDGKEKLVSRTEPEPVRVVGEAVPAEAPAETPEAPAAKPKKGG